MLFTMMKTRKILGDPGAHHFIITTAIGIIVRCLISNFCWDNVTNSHSLTQLSFYLESNLYSDRTLRSTANVIHMGGNPYRTGNLHIHPFVSQFFLWIRSTPLIDPFILTIDLLFCGSLACIASIALDEKNTLILERRSLFNAMKNILDPKASRIPFILFAVSFLNPLLMVTSALRGLDICVLFLPVSMCILGMLLDNMLLCLATTSMVLLHNPVIGCTCFGISLVCSGFWNRRSEINSLQRKSRAVYRFFHGFFITGLFCFICLFIVNGLVTDHYGQADWFALRSVWFTSMTGFDLFMDKLLRPIFSINMFVKHGDVTDDIVEYSYDLALQPSAGISWYPLSVAAPRFRPLLAVFFSIFPYMAVAMLVAFVCQFGKMLTSLSQSNDKSVIEMFKTKLNVLSKCEEKQHLIYELYASQASFLQQIELIDQKHSRLDALHTAALYTELAPVLYVQSALIYTFIAILVFAPHPTGTNLQLAITLTSLLSIDTRKHKLGLLFVVASYATSQFLPITFYLFHKTAWFHPNIPFILTCVSYGTLIFSVTRGITMMFEAQKKIVIFVKAIRKFLIVD